MIILGLNAFHGDAAAALVKDGQLIAAAEEERFRRVKHWAGFPSEAIAFCLREAGIDLADVDYVALNQDSGAHRLRKLAYLLGRRPSLALLRARWKNRGERDSVPELLERHFPGQRFNGSVAHVEHHLAHLSSAFHVSPFRDAAILSIDGFGDFASAAWGVGHEAEIAIEGRVFFPHSLGVFYQAITQYLGFPNYGDEYKVMGLASYGRPTVLPKMRQVVLLRSDGTYALDLSYFRHHREPISFEWHGRAPQFADLFSKKLEGLLGPRRAPDEPIETRHRDIAASAQAMYEEALFSILRRLQERHKLPELALAGGCAMNSVANGKIRRVTNFKRVYVQAAAGDAGGAVGAAFALWHRQGGGRSCVMEHAYWGPGASGSEIEHLLARKADELAAARCTVSFVSSEDVLCSQTAAAISAGKVVGWFQGRMEWGPRALGNRSILADPRRADIKDLLNAKIKRRESFRPFAPSILEPFVAEWFEEDDAVPFMQQVFQIRENKHARIPAVTHVDGSGRLQTVSERANPRFYRLIDAFRTATGVPLLLNTSFNENEPIVCRPEEALDCFLRTRMDMLVLGDVLIERSGI